MHTDVLALADCFEAVRGTFQAELKLDVCHFVSIPSVAMQSALLLTRSFFELICEVNGEWVLLNDVDEGIMGGQYVCVPLYAAANNPKL